MMDVEKSGPGCQCLEEINEEHSRRHWSLKEWNPVSLHTGGKQARSKESVRKLIRRRRVGISWCSHVKLFGVIGVGEMGLSGGRQRLAVERWGQTRWSHFLALSLPGV